MLADPSATPEALRPSFHAARRAGVEETKLSEAMRVIKKRWPAHSQMFQNSGLFRPDPPGLSLEQACAEARRAREEGAKRAAEEERARVGARRRAQEERVQQEAVAAAAEEEARARRAAEKQAEDAAATKARRAREEEEAAKRAAEKQAREEEAAKRAAEKQAREEEAAKRAAEKQAREDAARRAAAAEEDLAAVRAEPAAPAAPAVPARAPPPRRRLSSLLPTAPAPSHQDHLPPPKRVPCLLSAIPVAARLSSRGGDADADADAHDFEDPAHHPEPSSSSVRGDQAARPTYAKLPHCTTDDDGLYLGKGGTGFKGVYKYNGRFTARIYIGEGTEESLGQFTTPAQAALKYARVRNEREAVWKQVSNMVAPR